MSYCELSYTLSKHRTTVTAEEDGGDSQPKMHMSFLVLEFRAACRSESTSSLVRGKSLVLAMIVAVVSKMFTL